MKNNGLIRKACAFAGAALALVLAKPARSECNPTNVASQQKYRALDIATLGFTPGPQKFGVEDILAINTTADGGGQVVGSFMVNGKRHAFLWLPKPAYGLCQGLHDLHTEANNGLGIPTEEQSIAHDISDAGFVAGQMSNHNDLNGGLYIDIDHGQALVWVLSASVKACPLGFLVASTDQWSVAHAINDDSPFPLVVGDGLTNSTAGCNDRVNKGFRAMFGFAGSCPTIVFELLDPLTPDHGAYARDIKETNVVSGPEVAGLSSKPTPLDCFLGPCEFETNPIRWPPDVPVNALTILNNGGGTQSRGINNARNLVGSGFTSTSKVDCFRHALFWRTPDAAPCDLGTVPPILPAQATHAEGINNLSLAQVVGWNSTTIHPLLWEQNAAGDWTNAIDLESATCDCAGIPGNFELRQAHDINDNGWIIAWGVMNSEAHAFLLRPMQQCPADLDGNGDVGTPDFLILLTNWTFDDTCANCADLCCTCAGDLNNDCKVNTTDFLALLGTWGPCPGFGKCPPPPGAAAPGSPQTLDQAAQALGFDDLAAFEAWLTVASQDEAFVVGKLFLELLQN